MNQICCELCRYYVEETDETGECRRHPPRIVDAEIGKKEDLVPDAFQLYQYFIGQKHEC